jgi:hypothetical protein
MRQETFSFAEVETALCVWEWLLEQGGRQQNGNDINMMIAELFDAYGSGGMRSSAVQAGVIVDKAFAEYEKHLEFGECFDWEFVPMVCRALDWDHLLQNNQYGDGCWTPDIPALVATLIAKRALAA